MSEIKNNENRFTREMKSIDRDNPNVDMDLVREWQEIKKTLERIPPADIESKPKEAEKPHLQPIPLRMFMKK